MFSTGSGSSTSLATVTPSLVTVGLPNFLSMTTLRPRGPNVALTASARASTPRFNRPRASTLKCSSFAFAIVSIPRWFLRRSADHGQDVGFLDDEVLFVVEPDFRAAVFSVQHLLADLQLHWDALTLLVTPRADGHDLALLRLLFRGVRDVEPAPHLLGFLQ